jgi:hypothetical protein
MNRRILFISSLLLVPALATAAAVRANSFSRDSRQPENSQRDDRSQGRVYDKSHRDWHDWNDNEERAYRQFLTETRRDYREFSRLDGRTQTAYWNWRHSHPDRYQDNRDRDNRGQDDRNRGGGKRYYDQNTGQWHDWNDNEDRAYRRYLDENHRTYVDFDHADLGLQLQFWLWRKFHQDGGEQGRGRYFDNDRREWHDWDQREEEAYRGFLVGNNRAYIEFSVAPPDLQVQYWAWRRSHPDRDDRRFKRYFDQGHNDWHVWDENEDRAYREFMNGRHWYYRELTELNPHDQQRYWDWRHKHPDKDRDRR